MAEYIVKESTLENISSLLDNVATKSKMNQITNKVNNGVSAKYPIGSYSSVVYKQLGNTESAEFNGSGIITISGDAYYDINIDNKLIATYVADGSLSVTSMGSGKQIRYRFNNYAYIKCRQSSHYVECIVFYD